MNLYEVLGIEETDILSPDEIQQAYGALIRRFHPDDIHVLNVFLGDPTQRSSEHWGHCLDAIETMVDDEHLLSPETLDVLSGILLHDADMEIRVRCCVLLARVACNDQLLPDTVLRALEHTLEHEGEELCSIASSALSRAFLNDQRLASNILPLIEFVFIRHPNARENIGLLLYAVLKKSRDHDLSLATYDTLSTVILDGKQAPEIQSCCYNILLISARNNQHMPEIVFEVLSIALEHPDEDIKEQAFYALMTCLAYEKNRQLIKSPVLTSLIASLEQALLGHNDRINKCAACTLCYLMSNEPTDSIELAELVQRRRAPGTSRNLLFSYLENSLQDIDIRQYAVSSLYYLLSQGHYEHGLLPDALFILGRMSQDPKNDLELRKKAIELMGLSARKNPLSDDPEDGELRVLELVLREKNVELTPSCLTTLSYHLNHSGAKCPPKMMKHVLGALNHEETFLDAIYVFKMVLDNCEECEKAPLLDKFLSVAKGGLFRRLVQIHEAFHEEVIPLLETAELYHPRDVQRIRLAFEEPAEDDTVDEGTPHAAPVMGGGDRTLSQLLTELKADNSDNDSILQLLKEEGLTEQLYDIAAAHEMDSLIIPLKKPIKEWDENDCLVWAKTLKTQAEKARDPAFLPEIIAVIAQGIILTTTYTPRVTQLISLLLLLHAKGKGRLAQIATGEGKSAIVAMLAAIKALQGEKVDVVSSSPVLAYRDALSTVDFFKLFDLTVASNWDPKTDDKMPPGLKECYLADIVYGDANHFQFDLLRDEYKEEKTRANRPYQTVIVDEVDSMLIDESMKIASLGTHKPLMADLWLLFLAVWIELERRTEELESGKITLPIDEEMGDVFTREKYLTLVLEQCFIKMINDSDSLVQVPKHLRAFALSQAPHWARSAVIAREHFILGKDYILTEEDGQKIIAPVDYMNTGVVHANSAWDDGLQQFLQIKEKLKFSSENLTASFISNMAYFKRYGQNIYGLTGTLGAEDAQKLLKEVYDLDLVFVPTYKEKDFTELPGIKADTADQWLEAIIASVQKETRQGRAVLVICESINAVEVIEAALNQAGVTKIKCYTRSDSDEHLAIAEQVDSGDVILATNLAGRGTDIKTTQRVEDKGGLYVCVTFLPHNLRVEEQAFGRTSRQGYKGTAQLIVKIQEAVLRLAQYPDLGDADTMENLKAWRNAVEEKTLQLVKEFDPRPGSW